MRFWASIYARKPRLHLFIKTENHSALSSLMLSKHKSCEAFQVEICLASTHTRCLRSRCITEKAKAL